MERRLEILEISELVR